MPYFNSIICNNVFRGAREFLDTGKTNFTWFGDKTFNNPVEVFWLVQYELAFTTTSEEAQFVVKCAKEFFPEYNERFDKLLILI